MTTPDVAPAVVTLTIPCAPEYVGTARLMIMSVAARLGFSVDMIEDIRMAVGEACTNAIERSDRSHRNGTESDAVMLTIRSQIEPSRLLIEVEDPIPDDEETSSAADPDNLELGPLLMGILVDEIAVEPLSGGGTRVRLIKHANPDAGDVDREEDRLP